MEVAATAEETNKKKNVRCHNDMVQHIIRDTHREKAPSKRLQKYQYGHLGRWYIKSTLYKRFLN